MKAWHIQKMKLHIAIKSHIFRYCLLTEKNAHISVKSRLHGNPFQYSCLENPMDRGAWWAAVHGVVNSWTQLSN